MTYVTCNNINIYLFNNAKRMKLQDFVLRIMNQAFSDMTISSRCLLDGTFCVRVMKNINHSVESKVQAIMKQCVRSISASINRSASRNILLKATKVVNLARHTQQNLSSSSSSSCDLTSSSSSPSLEDLLQEFDLKIMNQDIVQI
jgi:hypothetical protein